MGGGVPRDRPETAAAERGIAPKQQLDKDNGPWPMLCGSIIISPMTSGRTAIVVAYGALLTAAALVAGSAPGAPVTPERVAVYAAAVLASIAIGAVVRDDAIVSVPWLVVAGIFAIHLALRLAGDRLFADPFFYLPVVVLAGAEWVGLASGTHLRTRSRRGGAGRGRTRRP